MLGGVPLEQVSVLTPAWNMPPRPRLALATHVAQLMLTEKERALVTRKPENEARSFMSLGVLHSCEPPTLIL